MLKIKKYTHSEPVYDISVPATENFFANNILIHNCVEVNHPTSPIEHIDSQEAEIGICMLGAVNILEVKGDSEFEKVCDIIVRILDEVIDIQEYPINAAKNFTTNRRSLAIGITNFAAALAKANIKYSSQEAPNFMDAIAEKLQYFCLKSSNQLAQEKGQCAKFHLTKYSDGIFPLDTYNKNVDEVVTRKPSQDWETLRASVKEHGLRHSTVTAQMPVESSSVIQNSTNGIGPVQSLLITKKSKGGILKQIVPHASHYPKRYELAYDLPDNMGYTNICAALQKWMDMSISQDSFYNYKHYPEKQLPVSKVIKELLYCYRLGIKSLYYCNTDDGDQQDAESGTSGCESGACTL